MSRGVTLALGARHSRIRLPGALLRIHRIRFLYKDIMAKRIYTKELLEEAVKNSTSIVSTCRYLGLKETKNGSYDHISKRIQEYNIDISHFYRGKGLVTKGGLEKLIDDGLTQEQIAKYFSLSETTIRYWLKKYQLYRCNKCGTLDKVLFYKSVHTTCKKCMRRRKKGYKIEAVEYKGGKCIKCGYNKCLAALDFHHRDPLEKDPDWRNLLRKRSLESIKSELDKCDLLCKNCHTELHYCTT